MEIKIPRALFKLAKKRCGDKFTIPRVNMAGVPGAWIECQHTGSDDVFTVHVPDGAGIEAPKPAPPAVKTAEEIIAGLGERQRFDAEAATLDDGTAANDRPVYNATTLNQLRRIRDRVREMGNTARSREWAYDEMLALIDAGPEAIREKPWRLPTFEETQGDPEAVRVWNAVHKPAPEWKKTAEVGAPPVVGKIDSPEWLASINRHVWAAADGGTVAWLSTAAAIRTAVACRQKVPDYWMEADTPNPPAPLKEREPLAEANEKMRAAVAQTNAERAERERATS